jgi:AmmeMemoRadiSam system protein B
MSTVRHPAVAGAFYPADPAALHAEIQSFLADADTPLEPPPKAVIVPHAGYVYSGPVAATAYARLRPLAGRVRRVVLLGPAHRVPFAGIAAPEAEWFETPLGRVHVDQAAIDTLADLPFVGRSDLPHAPEHSLEVQLPFLQEVLGDFELVPLVVGQATPEQVAAVLDRLWGGDETLIVVSSDLSHYLPYEQARRIDAVTSEAIAQMRDDAIDHEQACGATPVRGLLQAARRRGLRAEIVDLRNSGDTAGPRDQVVGYGAYVFH